MRRFDFKKFKELYQEKIDKQEDFNTEDFLKKNKEKLKNFKKIKNDKPSIFSNDGYED